MKHLISIPILLVLAAGPGARGAEESPARLSPREVEEGWILLFDGETTFGWHTPQGSRWTVAEGMLAPQGDRPALLVCTTPFRDYDLKVEYQVRPRSKAALRLGCDAEGKLPQGQEPVTLTPLGGGWVQMAIQVRQNHPVSIMGTSSSPVGKTGFVTTPSPRPDRAAPGGSHIALEGIGFVVRGIRLKPARTQSLFNGKDLTGWKIHPDLKSRFSVSPRGWLHIEDGRGDLQTEGQWSDFVLQLACKTNGDRLNSGLFFRCIPDAYQQGYEAQIHNGFSETATREYTVEVYDPQTHELKEKKQVSSTALDYGTGGIYRRIPARRAVARDREWFTMTVAASGRHIATWVNGIQVVSWTDNRPSKENPRQGYRAEKGAISLQGHDPTTDLDFRDIRIADLTGK